MLNLDFYLNLFPPSTQEKPRFMALASAILSQANDLLSLIQTDLPEAYNLDKAVGAQLDAIGVLMNTPRPFSSTPDDDYRFLLRARIAAHHWDGTNETLPAVLAAAFPDRDAAMIDNQDGTVSVSLSGDIPFSLEDIFPVPAGIRLYSRTN